MTARRRSVKSTNNHTTLTEDVLLRGSIYALMQCGLLLADAVLLLESRRHATAVGIGLLAREQLGLHRKLLDHWRQSATGSVVTIGDVRKGSDDHLEKQRRSQSSVTYRAQRGDGYHLRLQARDDAPPGSKDRHESDIEIQAIDEIRWNRQPSDRVARRERAFYVDLDDDGRTWRRPADLTASECVGEIQDVQTDYYCQRDRILTAGPIHNDQLLADAIATLDPPPTFPLLPPISTCP